MLGILELMNLGLVYVSDSNEYLSRNFQQVLMVFATVPRFANYERIIKPEFLLTVTFPVIYTVSLATFILK